MSDEIIRAIGGVAGSGLGLKLLYDALGPTAKQTGMWIRELAFFRFQNVERIMDHAQEAAADEDIPEEWAAHPRVVQRVIDESPMLDDDVMRAYAGGLIASSRTPDGKDDRGVSFVDQLNRMTAVETRFHHIIYHEFARLYIARQIDRDKWTSASISVSYVPLLRTLFGDMFNVARTEEAVAAMDALARDALIGSLNYSLGGEAGTQVEPGKFRLADMTFKFSPTRPGAALFLWAHGLRTSSVEILDTRPLREFDPPGPQLSS